MYFILLNKASLADPAVTKKFIETYTKEEAANVIDIIDEFNAHYSFYNGGKTLAYASDEFYLIAERELPDAEYYGEFSQLDNGVGLVRSFYDDFTDEIDYCDKATNRKKVTLATGADFFPYLCDLCKKAEEKYKIEINVRKIINNFFGETITVSGLITGTDLYEQLKNDDLGEYLLLPSSMISDYTNHTENKNKFLDDMTVEELEERLNTKIILTKGDGGQLLKDILGVE